jgi:hypothetical protein
VTELAKQVLQVIVKLQGWLLPTARPIVGL